MTKAKDEAGIVPPTPAERARDLAPLPDHPSGATPILRFAPSPNGALHPGHAYSALLNRHLADAHGGRMLVRVEDLDAARCAPALERAMLDDLAWLGVASDGPVLRQGERSATYRAALDDLATRRLVYPAFLSRGEVKRRVAEAEVKGRAWPRDPDGAPHYPGDDRTLDPGEARARILAGAPHGWRLDTAAALAEIGDATSTSFGDASCPEAGDASWSEGSPRAWGDPLLWRADGTAAYHLAATLDDAAQGITHVVRGADLTEATAVHRLLQRLLGLPAPLYRHHALVRGPDGAKLAKSRGDRGIAAWREAGGTPRELAAWLGLA